MSIIEAINGFKPNINQPNLLYLHVLNISLTLILDLQTYAFKLQYLVY